ncbi:MAG: hypothetical protein IPP77_12075 [Bacteroidetes bacterium]|nr:hypothetical protein [Bacteroidota bacterium]
MKLSRIIYPALFLLLLFAGCKKEEAISEVPSIKFVSMNPNPAIRYQDELVITIEYTDGNGDLGENTPDAKNLFVRDNRNNVTSEFRIRQLAPDNANIIISGPLKINLPPQGFIDDNNTTETATYSIYLVDRAGNQSNTIETPALMINK